MPVRPPHPVPEPLQARVDMLSTSVKALFTQKGIPYWVMAQMAGSGYTTMEDLADRWDTPALARQHAALPAGKATGLDTVCDRRQILIDWDRMAQQPRPKLTYQGSDNFLKKQFKHCAMGEIGFFQTKNIISALPDTDEKPIKVKRKATFDGWEREIDEEERAFPTTKEQIKKMHQVFRNNLYMCLISFPQHPQFNVTKTDLDDWYEWFWGKDIADRKPPPSEQTLIYAERNAWREIHHKVYEGSTLRDAMQTV